MQSLLQNTWRRQKSIWGKILTSGWPDARDSASCWTTTACSWSACQAGKVCWSATTAATYTGTGETATEDGHDDNKEFAAARSTDNINTDQLELQRNIFLLTKDQMLEVQDMFRTANLQYSWSWYFDKDQGDIHILCKQLQNITLKFVSDNIFSEWLPRELKEHSKRVLSVYQ